MSRITARGVPALDAARVVQTLSPSQLRAQLDGAPLGNLHDAPGGCTSGGFVLSRVEVIVQAATNLDAHTLTSVYAETMEKYGLLSAWTDVFAPSLRRIGQNWKHGLLGVDSEHLASRLLSRELSLYSRRVRTCTSGHITVLLAAAEGDLHSLPLDVVEAYLAQCGVRCIHLGANVPAEALATAVDRHLPTPHHVLLWASLDRPSPDPTWEHLRTIGHTPHIITAGPGWTSPEGRDGARASVPCWVDHADGIRQALYFLTTPGLVSREAPPTRHGPKSPGATSAAETHDAAES